MKKKFLEKIVINVGIGRLSQKPQFKDKVLPEVMEQLAKIAGQRGAVRRSKKSISNFKTRAGDPVGIQITLRGKKMEDFFEKLIHIAFPRVKDFRGIDEKSIDEMGNLNIGFREQYVFPEINIDRSNVSFGMQVTVVPLDKHRVRAIDFYKSSHVPLKS
jgi:large subunit ribosomal protein L5